MSGFSGVAPSIGRDIAKKSETGCSIPPANTAPRLAPFLVGAVVVGRQRSLPPEPESATLVRTGRPAHRGPTAVPTPSPLLQRRCVGFC